MGQYPLDTLNSAPKIRTNAIRQALSEIADVTFITGTRHSRRPLIWRLLQELNYLHFDCVYLEAATSTSMELDWLLLKRLQDKGVPIGIFIRDAYQLFGQSPTRTPKEKLLYAGWFLSQWVYRKTASTLFFPSRSLAAYFPFPHQVALPPAGRPALWRTNMHQNPRWILYAGNLDDESGWPLLKEAMQYLVCRYPDVRLLAVSPTTLKDVPAWLILRPGTLSDMREQLTDVACAVIPRPTTPYNHLAMPVKLMDYMSLGLPVVATPCYETSQFVSAESIGLIAEPRTETFAQAIARMLNEPVLRQHIIQHGFEALHKRHTWHHRAERILDSLLPQTRVSRRQG
ncbi:MAG: glycosyltransferase family 4 protein [Candidatus Sericytochromatia bacterium]|nr:glycosyltransferase family 4 protein [Candidatus Sericytochromatia bacterium]